MEQHSRWSSADSAALYGIERWSNGFFSIHESGDMLIHPTGEPAVAWNLEQFLATNLDDDIRPPLMLRLPSIIECRIKELNEAFRNAIEEYDYRGKYRAIYPVKVNPHRQVISAVLKYGRPHGIGLEAGTKAELMAVLIMADPDTPILCNGFKDSMMIELAIRATQLGRDITVIIEKPNEIDLVAEAAKRLGACPRLGLRVKLAAQANGRWAQSGGYRSKFGLTVNELVDGIERLRQNKLLESLHLLHFHPGSQISDVRKIKSSLIEATRVYADLVQQGICLTAIDVGGGLAVDYTGNQNTEASSMNYTLREYANDVVYYIQMVCDQAGIPHPNIMSESGRALVAHHAILLVPTIGVNLRPAVHELEPPEWEKCKSIPPLMELAGVLDELNENNLMESFHDAQQAVEMVQQLFNNGMLTLSGRALAEKLFWTVCGRICDFLDDLEFVPKELAELRDRLPDTYFLNFSLFQSIPDQWAIDQQFPIMPIHHLEKRPGRLGVMGDITCDSDGSINCFIGEGGVRRSLPLHDFDESQPYWLAIFLVGAYQEMLGDCHNLLGEVHVVTVDNEHGRPVLTEVQLGANVCDVLKTADHMPDIVRESIARHIEESCKRRRVAPELRAEIEDFMERMMNDYCYLSRNAAAGEAASAASVFAQMVGARAG
jgi:arginine decarboxylase